MFLESSWRALENRIEKIRTEHPGHTISIRCCIPFCLGFKESLSPEEVRELLMTIEDKGYLYTLYLYPENEECLEKYESIFDCEEEGRVRRISAWRESEAWQNASDRFESYYKKNEKDIDQKIGCDIERHQRKYNRSAEDIRAHVIREAKDCLSFLPQSMQENEIILTVLMYKNSLPFIMEYTIKQAKMMGYACEKDYFVHVKFKLTNKEYVNQDHSEKRGDRVLNAIQILGEELKDDSTSLFLLSLLMTRHSKMETEQVKTLFFNSSSTPTARTGLLSAQSLNNLHRAHLT